MKSSEAWVKQQSGQNVMVRVSQTNVMQRFGPRPMGSVRKPMKPEKESKFIVGETEIGGEEEV